MFTPTGRFEKLCSKCRLKGMKERNSKRKQELENKLKKQTFK